MLTRFAALMLAFGLACAAVPVRAQEVDRIAAVVNDEIITNQDLDGRLKMAMAMSNLPDTIDNRRRVLPQVLRKMIDERLQLQEANRLKITITAGEIDGGIAMVEKQNGMPRGALLPSLQRSGVDPEVVREQLKADLLWLKVSGRRLQPQIRIGEEEVDERLEAIKARQGRPEYLVSEIFIAVETLRQEEEARHLGERLLDQLRQGAPFPALARQFSQSPTAANGGSMGWVSEAGLEDELAQTLAHMERGRVSGLVRTTTGYYILGLADRRVAGASANLEDAKISLAQVVFPLPPPGTPNAPPRPALSARAAQITAEAKNCDDLEAIGRRVHSQKSGRVDNVQLGELPQHTRRAVAELPVNRASAPVDLPEGVLVAMVCHRENPPVEFKLPSREAIRRVIEDERLDMLARRYLRDLRRAAFVDIRM